MANVPGPQYLEDGTVIPGQRARVRTVLGGGASPQDYYEGQLGHVYAEESGSRVFTRDGGFVYGVHPNRVVDPKSGTVIGKQGEIVHDPNPPMIHNQPSHPDAVELPEKTKCFYDLLHLQSRQINLLGKMMNMLVRAKALDDEEEDDWEPEHPPTSPQEMTRQVQTMNSVEDAKGEDYHTSTGNFPSDPVSLGTYWGWDFEEERPRGPHNLGT